MSRAAAHGLAALQGLAIGDALGMPTQMMSRAAVTRAYGNVDTFLAAAADHPLAAQMAAGSVTDDTEQALLVADLLVAGRGHVDPTALAAALIAWENRMRARGSLDLLGPSTKRAVQSLVDGASPDEAGRYGTTNGAAMRITPIGIVMRSDDLDALVDRVVEVSRVSHHTGVALAGASAVAAAVSAGLDGADLDAATELAVRAAELGAQRGHWVAAGDVARRIQWAVSLADPSDVARSLDDLEQLVGTSLATQESVPLVFGLLALVGEDPWAVVTAAASLGGDSDTVAAMAGAIAGACRGSGAFPEAAVSLIERVNDLDLGQVADALVALR